MRILLLVLFAWVALGDDRFPPCWRNAPSTTFQSWIFTSSNSPAIPEQYANSYGIPGATFSAGPSGAWLSLLPGTKQGGWALGQGGSISLAIPNCGGSSSSWKYVAVQVTWFWSALDGVPAVSLQPGTQLVFSSVTNEVVESSGSWMVSQWILRLEPCVATETVVITAPSEGSLIDQVMVDTVCLESIVPIDVTMTADLGQCSKANVPFSFSYPLGCVVTNISCSPASGSTFLVGVSNVTCTVTDFMGRQANGSFKVTVTDTELPTIICPVDSSVSLDPGLCTAVEIFSVGFDDNCPGATVACVPPSGSAFPKGETTVNCTVTDASGNTNTCSFRIVLNDVEWPTITCADIVQGTDPGSCTAVVNFVPIFNDNCPGATLVCTPPSGGTFVRGETGVYCVVTDSSGRAGECVFKVTVNDAELPTITCPTNIVQNTDPGRATAIVSFAPIIADNCAGATLVCSPPSGTAFPTGVTTVNCTVTDGGSNSANCSFTVTVNDTERPTLTCPVDSSVSLDPGLCTAVEMFSVGFEDNCPGAGVVCIPPSGSVFPKGETTVRCTATDASGNSNTCSFRIVLNDVEAPTITCPADIVQNVDAGQCTAVLAFNPIFDDNCPGASLVCTPPSGSAFARGETTVYCVVSDITKAADCSFRVTVNDPELPTITCSNIVRSTDSGQSTALVSYALNANDNCPGAILVCTPPSETAFPTGQTTVNCTLTDGSSNTVNCSFTVTVQDTERPTITCPVDSSVSLDPGLCTAVEVFSVGFEDNCPGAGVFCIPPSGSVFPKGETTVSCTATDASGNTNTCSFRIVLNDVEAPTITCPADMVQRTDPGLCTALVHFEPIFNDNCPGASVLCTPPTGSLFTRGETTIYCVATDTSGRAGECSFKLTVNDAELPTITCSTNIVVNTDPGRPTAIVSFATSINDNCPGASVVCTPSNETAFATGETTVNCTVTDASGNSAACSFTVTVNDFELPRITCPVDSSVSLDPGLCTAVETFSVGFEDNCPGASLVCIPPSGSAFPKGENTVNCTVTDPSGNTAACSFRIMLHDTERPTVTCPGDILLNAEAGLCTALVTFTNIFHDNCEVASVVCTPPSGSAFARGVTTVYCVVTDTAGLKGDCSFNVTVIDNQLPTITCPPDMVRNTDPGMCTAVVAFTPTVIDNCADASIVCTPASGTAFAIGETNVNCIVTDAGGYVLGCTFKIRIHDAEPPTFICADVVTNVTTLCSQVVNFAPTVSDPCGVTNLICVPPSGTIYNPGVTVVTCLANDHNGNSNSCNFAVWVQDPEPPVITCPANILTNSGTPLCGQRAVYSASVSDNCGLSNLVCMPPSGSVFGLGTNIVTCVAVDISGTSNSCSFQVVVLDTSPPTVSCPANIVTNVTTGCSQAVAFDVGATDNCSCTVTCSPPSGATFPVGETLVSCLAVDLSGNARACTFKVTVIDSMPPALLCPGNITTNAAAECTQIVSFEVGAADNCLITNLLCTPPSGAAFALGTTQVTCVSRDASGNSSQCIFTVTVLDQEAPLMTCPEDQLNLPADPNRARTVVIWTAPAVSDNCSASVVCQPPSGSLFGPGRTTVNCTATDPGGTTAACSFQVSIVDMTPPVRCLNPPLSYSGGIPDDFVGSEASSPSPNQLVRLNFLDLKGFDNCLDDSVFAHSFAALPPNISQAVVKIKLKACADAAPENDTIMLGITSPEGSMLPGYWSRRIGSNLEDNLAGLLLAEWKGGAEHEFVLDLSKLSSTNNSNLDLLPAMNRFGYLDVYVQDDTAVDYIVLEVVTCECQEPIVVTRDPKQCGTNLIYSVPAFVDNCDANPLVVCSPPPGAFFPIGQTVVDCVATDAYGNTSRCQFRVDVADISLALSVQQEGTNVVLLWPASCGNYVLEQTPTVNEPASWSRVKEQSQLTGSQRKLILPATNARFFRLRQQ